MRIAFTPVDELGRVFERRAEPNTIHFEVQVPGSIDADRLRRAVREVLAAHPLLRARRHPAGPARRSYWEIAEHADLDPLAVCGGSIDAERERLFAEPVDLRNSPLMRLRLIKTPERDAVLLGAHHALFDGVSCLRLMRSIVAAYSGEPDPVPPIDPLTVRTATAPHEQQAGKPSHTPVAPHRTARIAGDTHSPGPGYGFALRVLDPEPTAALSAARWHGASVNDVLLAALFETVAAWNRRHASAHDRMTITMPLNARPAQHRLEFLGNLSRIVSIGVTDADRTDSRRLLDAITRQTDEAKRHANPRPAGLVGAVLGAGRLPYTLRRALLAAGRVAAGAVTDTTCLSNIGRIPGSFCFQGAGEIDRLWASPPAPMPRGLSVGATTYGGRLHLTVRHRHALLDTSAADEFATLLVSKVHSLAAEIAAVTEATGTTGAVA
ncbi:condensation domain-containing protein [Catenulispora subtropica]|uniref:Condensation domain-containing protein n=1 Tax=Catenulispora subtropica TaxID=450798 RepID=A0ABP5DZA2_9ACTN